MDDTTEIRRFREDGPRRDRGALAAAVGAGLAGMDVAAAETGGDPGYVPARAAYEGLGSSALPVVRYLKLFDESQLA